MRNKDVCKSNLWGSFEARGKLAINLTNLKYKYRVAWTPPLVRPAYDRQKYC